MSCRTAVLSPVAYPITPPFQHTSFTVGSLGLAARSASKMGWSFRPTMTKCSTGLAIAGKGSAYFMHALHDLKMLS